jgi:hypothetical protein
VCRCRWSASPALGGCLREVVRAPLARPRRVLPRFGSDAKDSNPRSLACSSRLRTRGRPSPPPGPPTLWSCRIARFDSARRLPRGPTLSSGAPANDASAPATRVRASPAARVCDSPEDFLFVAATRSRGDTHTRVFLRTPRRSVHRRFGQPGFLAASFGSKDSIG